MSAKKVETIDQPDREQVLAAVDAAAFDTGKDCEHCNGSGRAAGGERVVHSMLGGFGADWSADSIAKLVRTSKHIRWGDGFNNHDLAVKNPADGKWLYFQVPHPAREST